MMYLRTDLNAVPSPILPLHVSLEGTVELRYLIPMGKSAIDRPAIQNT